MSREVFLIAAMAANRVIGADGSLTGFGGGLPAKRWLLAHEARIAPQPGSQADLFA